MGTSLIHNGYIVGILFVKIQVIYLFGSRKELVMYPINTSVARRRINQLRQVQMNSEIVTFGLIRKKYSLHNISS